MVVGVCEVELHLPGTTSLKAKRLVLRSLQDRLRRRHNVAVSESDHHDQWQRAALCIVTVSNDSAVVYSILSRAQQLVEGDPRVELVDVHVELR
jgi:uncharacterized protein YlxP (DUF503 family)